MGLRATAAIVDMLVGTLSGSTASRRLTCACAPSDTSSCRSSITSSDSTRSSIVSASNRGVALSGLLHPTPLDRVADGLEQCGGSDRRRRCDSCGAGAIRVGFWAIATRRQYYLTVAATMAARASSASTSLPRPYSWRSPPGVSMRAAAWTPPAFTGSKPAAEISRSTVTAA